MSIVACRGPYDQVTCEIIAGIVPWVNRAYRWSGSMIRKPIIFFSVMCFIFGSSW